MKHKVDANFYPGFTRKAISFTIDDGNISMDRKFLDIMRPAGIRGTFNLCSHTADKAFAQKYGNRPRDYYYASVGDIFDYAAAVKQIIIAEDHVSNPSSRELFVTIDNSKRTIKPGETIVFSP